MLELHKNIVLDENQKPIAVQIPIEEFQRLEEVIENYGLAKLIDEVTVESYIGSKFKITHIKKKETVEATYLE